MTLDKLTPEQQEDQRPKYYYTVRRANKTVVNAGTDQRSWFTIEEAREIAKEGDTILFFGFLETL